MEVTGGLREVIWSLRQVTRGLRQVLKASDKSLEASARSLGAQCSASKGRADEVGATEILGVMQGSLGASGRLFRISAM